MNFLAFRRRFPFLWNGYTYNPEAFQDYFRVLEVYDEQGRRKAKDLGKAFLGKQNTSAINQNR